MEAERPHDLVQAASSKEWDEQCALAHMLHKNGLAPAALFFIELHSPLRGIMHAGSIIIEPILSAFIGRKHTQTFTTLFENQQNLQNFITLLEEPPQSRPREVSDTTKSQNTELV